MTNFNDFCEQGGGKMGYIFHAAGMPWAATSSAKLSEQLEQGSSTAWIQNMRRHMFSDANAIINSAAYYPADHVPLIPTLSGDVGNQSISYDESRVINVGSWNVTISDNMNGHRFRDWGIEPVGLPGVRSLPDALHDPGVRNARLALDYPSRPYGRLTWMFGFTGFKAAILAKQALNEPFYVWCGTSCFLISDTATVGVGVSGGIPYNYVAVTNRVFQTPDETIWRDFNTDRVYQNVYMYDAPVDGIVGMPGYLWGIPLDNDGNILDTSEMPTLLRVGRINTNPSGTPGQWKITCSGFTDLLKKKVTPMRTKANLAGFVFSREPTGTSRQPAHIAVTEFYYSGGTPTQNSFELNLCAAGSSVMYTNLDDLKQAVLDALKGAGASRFSAGYYYDETGDLCFGCNSTTYPDAGVYLTGSAVAPLGVGWWESENLEARIANLISMLPDSQDGVRYIRQRGNTLPNYIDKNKEAKWIPANYPAKYFIQNDFSDAAYTGGSETGELLPCGEYLAGGGVPCFKLSGDALDRKLYVDGDSDTGMFSPGDIFSIGNEDDASAFKGSGFVEELHIGVTKRYLVGKVNAVDVSGGWLTTSSIGAPFSSFGSDVLSCDESRGLFDVSLNGVALSYFPDLQEADPWVLTDVRKMSSDKPSDLFRAMLGDLSLGINVPARISITSVPFVLPAHQITLIDWDSLDSLVSASGMGDAEYGLYLKTKDTGEGVADLTVFNMLAGVCGSHNISMAWEYSAAQGAWWLTFSNSIGSGFTTAIQENRRIDAENIVAKSPSYKIGNEWAYSGVSLEITDRESNSYKNTYKVGVDKKQSTSGGKSLTVKDVTTRPSRDFMEGPMHTLMSAKAEALAVTSYTQSIQLSVNALTAVACGKGCIATSPVLINPATGAYGVEDHVVLVKKEVINLGASAGVDVVLSLVPQTAMGQAQAISPSMWLAASDIILAGVNLSITNKATADDFTPYFSPFTDLATFDCYSRNASTGQFKLRNCGCADYAVIVVRTSVTKYIDSGVFRNMYHGTIGLVNLSTGTATITLDDTTNFDDSLDHVCFFEKRSHAGLQLCQVKQYGWLGDSEGLVTDSGGNKHTAITWRSE